MHTCTVRSTSGHVVPRTRCPSAPVLPPPTPTLLAVEDLRAKERFAEQVPTSALVVSVGGWHWAADNPRPAWRILKEAKVWTDPAYASLRTSLKKPPPMTVLVTTPDEAHVRIADLVYPGPAPKEDSELEREEAEAAAAEPTQPVGEGAGRRRARKRRRGGEEAEAETEHQQRVYLYKAGGDVPDVADKCPVGFLLVHAPPQTTVRLPPQVNRLLENTPVAVYGSPANVRSVVQGMQQLVGHRDSVEVDVWVKPNVPQVPRLVKRSLVLVSKKDWLVLSRVRLSPCLPLSLPCRPRRTSPSPYAQQCARTCERAHTQTHTYARSHLRASCTMHTPLFYEGVEVARAHLRACTPPPSPFLPRLHSRLPLPA